MSYTSGKQNKIDTSLFVPLFPVLKERCGLYRITSVKTRHYILTINL
jgi:hypothetical protein